MRFVDFLRVTTLLSAGAASLLASLCVIGASADGDASIVLIAAGWWAIAAVLGLLAGRRNATTPPIARLLADSRAATMMPDVRPGATIVNRLWPLFLLGLASGVIAFLAPQVPGIAAGFLIAVALYWRRQDAAVEAIEERDGVTFYVERTSPVRPMQLVRIPGFRRERLLTPTAG
jgi:hypothetical protein